jgi:hypothetical protein
MSTLEKDIQYIKEALRRIEKDSRQPETWISPTWVMNMTGWNAKKMEQARKQGVVKFREKKSRSFEYLLQSIPEQFIIKKVA